LKAADARAHLSELEDLGAVIHRPLTREYSLQKRSWFPRVLGRSEDRNQNRHLFVELSALFDYVAIHVKNEDIFEVTTSFFF